MYVERQSETESACVCVCVVYTYMTENLFNRYWNIEQ